MRETAAMVGATAVIALGVAGCGGAGSAITAHKLAKDPQVQKDVQAAKQKINKCGGFVKFVNKSSRNTVIACIAPPGQRVQMEKCVQGAATRDHMFGPSALRPSVRRQFYVDAAGCLVR